MKKLDPKVNLYILILRSFLAVIIYAFLIITILIPESEFEITAFKYILIGIASFLILLTIPYHLIIPFFTYKLFGYEVREEEIIIKKGVLFKRETVIPVKRIQHLEKVQGPIQLLFKHASIQIFTAGSVEVIMGLNSLQADSILNEIYYKLNIYLNSDEVLNDD